MGLLKQSIGELYCELCNKLLASSSGLKRHYERVHSDIGCNLPITSPGITVTSNYAKTSIEKQQQKIIATLLKEKTQFTKKINQLERSTVKVGKEKSKLMELIPKVKQSYEKIKKLKRLNEAIMNERSSSDNLPELHRTKVSFEKEKNEMKKELQNVKLMLETIKREKINLSNEVCDLKRLQETNVKEKCELIKKMNELRRTSEMNIQKKFELTGKVEELRRVNESITMKNSELALRAIGLIGRSSNEQNNPMMNSSNLSSLIKQESDSILIEDSDGAECMDDVKSHGNKNFIETSIENPQTHSDENVLIDENMSLESIYAVLTGLVKSVKGGEHKSGSYTICGIVNFKEKQVC